MVLGTDRHGQLSTGGAGLENKAGQFKIYGQGELDPGRNLKIYLKIEIPQIGIMANRLNREQEEKMGNEDK